MNNIRMITKSHNLYLKLDSIEIGIVRLNWNYFSCYSLLLLFWIDFEDLAWGTLPEQLNFGVFLGPLFHFKFKRLFYHDSYGIVEIYVLKDETLCSSLSYHEPYGLPWKLHDAKIQSVPKSTWSSSSSLSSLRKNSYSHVLASSSITSKFELARFSLVHLHMSPLQIIIFSHLL